MFFSGKSSLLVFCAGLFVALFAITGFAADGDVMKGFNQAIAAGGSIESFETIRWQHKVLFYMGFVLLASILGAAYFGIQMAMFGKQVFVPHMIFAGVTVFLSIAHAVVALVWFNPFK